MKEIKLISFGIYEYQPIKIPFNSRILDLKISDYKLFLIYEYDIEELDNEDKKSISFFIQNSSSLSGPAIQYHNGSKHIYYKTIFSDKYYIASNNSVTNSNSISFDLLKSTETYHIYVDDFSLIEDRDNKIKSLL